MKKIHYVGVTKKYQRVVFKAVVETSPRGTSPYLYVIGPMTPQKALAVQKKPLPQEVTIISTVKERLHG